MSNRIEQQEPQGAADLPVNTRLRGAGRSRLWRLVIWLVAIHLGVFGVFIALTLREMADALQIARPALAGLGIFRGTAVWLVINSELVFALVVASDAAALVLSWTVLRGLRPMRTIALYLGLTLGLVIAHATAALIVAGRQFDTGAGGFDFSSMSRLVALGDLLMALPALLFVLTLAWKGLPRTDPHVCRRCGYDLRATPDRCPECGTDVGSW